MSLGKTLRSKSAGAPLSNRKPIAIMPERGAVTPSNPHIKEIHIGTYAATLLLGGLVAMLSLIWLTKLGLHFSQGAGMAVIAMATLYSAELYRFLERRIGRLPRP